MCETWCLGWAWHTSLVSASLSVLSLFFQQDVSCCSHWKMLGFPRYESPLSFQGALTCRGPGWAPSKQRPGALPFILHVARGQCQENTLGAFGCLQSCCIRQALCMCSGRLAHLAVLTAQGQARRARQNWAVRLKAADTHGVGGHTCGHQRGFLGMEVLVTSLL